MIEFALFILHSAFTLTVFVVQNDEEIKAPLMRDNFSRNVPSLCRGRLISWLLWDDIEFTMRESISW